MRIPLNITATALFGLSLAAHAGEHIRWTEEVKLSNSEVIEIHRHVELTESGFPVQRRGFDKFHEICYPPLGIHWKSRPGYQPDIFDIVDGKAYVHVPVSAQHECYEQGYPEPNALYFVWEDRRWKRISHEEFPASSEWNLLLSYVAAAGYEKDDAHGLITWTDKRRRPSSLRDEQKRFGWKRVNESYAERTGCKRWSKTSTELKSDAVSIFVNDVTNTCQP